MAMFSSAPRDADSTTSTRTKGPETLSILAAGTRIKGEVEVDGVIKIEGTIEGTVRAHGQVLVVKGGIVEGDIYARQAIIGGEARGAVCADERVEVQATSVVNGDITTPQITVLEGGRINGNIRMENPHTFGKKGAPANPVKPEGNPGTNPRPPINELRRTG
jgi:cytoskeletal protein CcmA (bactofilin family)